MVIDKLKGSGSNRRLMKLEEVIKEMAQEIYILNRRINVLQAKVDTWFPKHLKDHHGYKG